MRSVCHWHQKLRDESGNVLVLVALCMTVLMGFTALAVDVGLMFRAKRELQTVADAAATAGALEYYNTNSGAGVSTASAAAATANGVTNGVGGAVVTVTSPVTSGAHTGPGTVEVDVGQPNPTFFMKVFGRSTMTVAAKAVAGQVPGQACVHINDSLIAKGSATIEGWDTTTNKARRGCGVYSKNNVDITGNGNTFNVAYVATSGTVTGNHNTNPAPVVQNAPVQDIPKKLQITPPTPSSFPSCNPPPGSPPPPTSGKNKGIITWTMSGALSPGCYGLGATGATSMNLTLGGATTTLAAGLYVFDLGTAGLLTLGNNVSGGSKADLSPGVTLDINTGGFKVSSTTNDTLYAPSNGAASSTAGYDGVLLLEPASNTGTIDFQWGSSSGDWYGYIDAPGASATMQDQGGAPLVTGLILNDLTINGTLRLNNYDDTYTLGAFRTIALVE
jgi:Flp pilus assembly protein TadG